MSTQLKTLAIRLESEQHAQLTILAKLTGTSAVDVIRDALSTHLDALAAQPEVAEQAEALRADIDAEADAQRAALTGLFGSKKPTRTNRST